MARRKTVQLGKTMCAVTERRCSKMRRLARSPACTQPGDCVAPEPFDEVAEVVQGEGDEVEGDEDGRQGLFAVAEIVLEVVAVVLEDVEGLVLDLPARAAAGGEFGDVVTIDRQVGDEAVAVGQLAGGVGDLDLQPVDREGVGAVAQGHVVEPSVAMDRAVAAVADGLAVLRENDARQVLAESGMRLRLAGEQEVSTHRLDRHADGLTGEQIVAEIDRLEMGISWAAGGQPAAGGSRLAVLLLVPVLRHDELRRQRQHMGVARRHHRCAEEAVEVFDPAVAALPARTLRAMDLARGEVLRSVERDQHVTAQTPERLEAATRLGLRDDLLEQPVEPSWRRAVQHLPDVVVCRDRRHAEQGLAIRPAVALRQRPLIRQKRRALHEEHSESRKPDVCHRVSDVAPPPLVRQASACLAHRHQQILENLHPIVESHSTAIRKCPNAFRFNLSHPHTSPDQNENCCC